MLRALVWKEWRQQRAVVAAGVGLAALLPFVAFAAVMAADGRVYLVDFAEMMPFLIAAMIWPLFAAIIGATAHADEKEGGSLGFLLSRPVTRGRVWGVKVAMAAAALSITVGVSFLIGQTAYNLFFSGGALAIDFPFVSDPIPNQLLSHAAAGVVAVGFTVTSFAGALLFAQVVRRPLTAALAGLGLGLFVTVFSIVAQTSFSASASSNDGSVRFLSWLFLLAIGAVVAVAYRVYARSDGARETGGWRTVGAGLASVVALLVVSPFGIAATIVPIEPMEARFDVIGGVPGTDTVVVRVVGTRFEGSPVAVVAADRPLELITDRMASAAYIAPSGDWIVYSTRMTRLGLKGSCTRRAVRPDGSDDHFVVPCGGSPLFARNSNRVIFSFGQISRFTIHDLDDPSFEHTIELVGTEAARGRMRGWVLDDTAVLIENDRRLFLVDTSDGEVSEIRPESGADAVGYRAHGGSMLALGTAVVTIDEDGEEQWQWRNHLYDLRASRLIATLPDCSFWRDRTFSIDGQSLVLECRNHLGEGTRLIHVDVEDGAESELLRTTESVFHIPSPGADRVYAGVNIPRAERRGGVNRRYVVIDRDGVVAEPDALRQRSWGWIGRYWLDDRRLIVQRTGPADWRSEVGIVDADTGELTVLIGGRTP